MLRDIRDLTGEQDEYAAELRRRWGADGAVAVRVVLHDEGLGDRAITAGSYLFRAIDAA